MSILIAENLRKYYGKEPNIVRALDGVSLSVEEGEFVAIVGNQRQREIHTPQYDGRTGCADGRRSDHRGEEALRHGR